MRARFLWILVLLYGWVTLAAAASHGWDSYGHGPTEFKSDRIRFASASLMFSPSNGLAIGFELENRSESPLWVKLIVRGADTVVVCDQTTALASKGRALSLCPRDTIVPDSDYPVAVEVYQDSGLTTVVERGGTQVRFHKKHLEEVGMLKVAAQLPRIYEHVAYKKKLGLATALFGQLGPPSEGTLTVSVEGVEWRSKKLRVHVPATQLRAVRMEQLGARSADAWVVVEYEEGGQKKLMALQPSAFRGRGPDDLRLIYTSLDGLTERR